MPTTMQTKLKLTAQQTAIVNHNLGPALVFAVAGAGKTTAMEHRIGRLVREGVFAPRQILAAAYNKSAADKLSRRLSQWPGCTEVKVATLHALGRSIVLAAFEKGYLPYLQKGAFLQDSVESVDKKILQETRKQAFQIPVEYKADLEHLDQDDFLDYVSICKGKLAYPDLKAVELPPETAKVTSQARKPTSQPWQLDLFKRFEQTRRELGLLTFDDYLLTAWEVLVSHKDILEQFQSAYQCVLVDEFQDVNLVQSEILDSITQLHRNYMVIGDDDQTIYEWRGAEAKFILEFEKSYNAQVYFMTENFRCKAGQVVLANRVIEHNQQRKPKRLELTQGFEGSTEVYAAENATLMGIAIANEIADALAKGYTLAEMAVLVRLYAQTPPIEQALIAANLPYEVVGDTPFYKRPEVTVLISYCRLAYLEPLLRQRQSLTPGQADQFRQSWEQVYWQPKRFISRALSQKIVDYVLESQLSLAETLRVFCAEVNTAQQKRLQQLADDLEWLAESFHTGKHTQISAKGILEQFEQRLKYKEYLEQQSATGGTKAANVDAFIDYAGEHGNLMSFLQHLRQLEVDAQLKITRAAHELLKITTIHRAKGAEWSIVFVPNCNQAIIPYARSESIEEERRLLYVAITRAKQHLHLYYLKNQPISQFLHEANYQNVLRAEAAIRLALAKATSEWLTRDLVALLDYAARLQLLPYFEQWWDWPAEQKRATSELLLRFYTALEQRAALKQLNIKPEHLHVWLTLAKPRQDRTPLYPLDMDQFLHKVVSLRDGPMSTVVQAPQKPEETKQIPQPWQKGTTVKHRVYGHGEILMVKEQPEGKSLWVRFELPYGLRQVTLDRTDLEIVKSKR